MSHVHHSEFDSEGYTDDATISALDCLTAAYGRHCGARMAWSCVESADLLLTATIADVGMCPTHDDILAVHQTPASGGLWEVVEGYAGLVRIATGVSMANAAIAAAAITMPLQYVIDIVAA